MPPTSWLWSRSRCRRWSAARSPAPSSIDSKRSRAATARRAGRWLGLSCWITRPPLPKTPSRSCAAPSPRTPSSRSSSPASPSCSSRSDAPTRRAPSSPPREIPPQRRLGPPGRPARTDIPRRRPPRRGAQGIHGDGAAVPRRSGGRGDAPGHPQRNARPRVSPTQAAPSWSPNASATPSRGCAATPGGSIPPELRNTFIASFAVAADKAGDADRAREALRLAAESDDQFSAQALSRLVEISRRRGFGFDKALLERAERGGADPRIDPCPRHPAPCRVLGHPRPWT